MPNLNLGAFFNDEGYSDGVRRDGTDLGTNGSELASVLGKQFLDHNFGFLHLRGIVLALHRECHFALLEAIEHVAGGNRIQAEVVDLANRRPLFDVDVQDPAFRILFTLKANVLEVAGVPKGVEVALDGGGVVDITDFAENAGFNCIRRDAAVAMDNDADNQVLLAKTRSG